MFNLRLILIAQVIEAETVFLSIHEFYEFALQLLALRSVYQTFKHGILDALAIVDALFGDFAKAFFTVSILCIHVIGNQHHHTIISFP